MDERGLLDLIIAVLPCLKNNDRIRLCEVFNSEEEFVRASKTDIEIILGHDLKLFWDIDVIRKTAHRDDEVCRMRSISRVSWVQPSYPPLLREIYDPPVLLFFRGRLPDPEKPVLGIVGTRRPSPQARIQTHAIARELGHNGISVVSGLALGIDAMAHRGNLDGGAPAYAILGSGVDEVYPSSNRPLAKRILESGGAILSEYPPGTGPRKWNFPARNRIISGLSRSVLIAEAPQRSGALITAGHALDQGREVWVASSGVRHQDNTEAYDSLDVLYDKRGTTKLAQDGAEVIYKAGDILDKWNLKTVHNNDFHIQADNSTGNSLAACTAKYLGLDL
jgi:DNA processing protein